MKKILFLFCSFLVIHAGYSQTDSNQPPYKKFTSFPPVKLLLPDSSTYFTKNDLQKKSPVMLMLFNPQCEHCRQATEDLLKNIDKFKDIQIIMSTSMLFDSMMTFREKYQLAQFENIVVAQDPNFFLPTYFMINSLPFLAFYDKKKELIEVFEGSLPVKKILAKFDK
ncbi:MAG: thioredoxin fold domain-containing protein [Chitinophagaceae bacterium]